MLSKFNILKKKSKFLNKIYSDKADKNFLMKLSKNIQSVKKKKSPIVSYLLFMALKASKISLFLLCQKFGVTFWFTKNFLKIETCMLFLN